MPPQVNVLPFGRRSLDDATDEAMLRQEVVDSLHGALTHATDGIRNVPIFLKEAFTKKVWEQKRILNSGGPVPPMTFLDFVSAPYPVGLGTKLDVLRKFIATDIDLLAAFDQASLRNAGGTLNPE